MSGKLVVIEGLDGSGKSTQVARLSKQLTDNRIPFKKIKLPDYESPSSSLVQMYLSGEFGNDPQDVNTYASSAFYAVDRFASFQTKWRSEYESGKLILADRYTTSNAIYQMVKLPENEWEKYLEWMDDFEYHKLDIPSPDLVIYLDVDIDVSQKLMTARYKGDESAKDLHESNVAFLKKCREAAFFSAEKLNWKIISCTDGDTLRRMEDISSELYSILEESVLV